MVKVSLMKLFLTSLLHLDISCINSILFFVSRITMGSKRFRVCFRENGEVLNVVFSHLSKCMREEFRMELF